MNITLAQYHNSPFTGEQVAIKATVNGVVMYVPIETGNTEYDEIMRQVAAGTLTIQEAD